MLYQLRGHREFRVAYSITFEHSFHRPVCMWEVLLELTLTEKSDLWLLWLKSNFDRDSFPVGLSCLPKTLNPKPPKCNKMLHPKLKQEWHLTDCPVHPTAKTPEPKRSLAGYWAPAFARLHSSEFVKQLAFVIIERNPKIV